jgi:hypothetical protein
VQDGVLDTPMYWFIGIQYFVPSATMAWSLVGSQ